MVYPEGVREELDRISILDPKNLTPEDAAFLRARRDYLDPLEKDKFFAVLLDAEPIDASDIEEFEGIKKAEEAYEASIADGSIDKPRVVKKKK